MRPSVEARFQVWMLLGLQLVTSLAGVVLLGRMTPEVERILVENVYSTEAVEDMLVVLATDRSAPAFAEALARATSNITEEGEADLLKVVEAQASRALAGEAAAIEEVTSALSDLGHVNRDSMRRAEETASRLGLAGAWAMALLGFLGFLMSLAVVRRVESRLLAPILEVDAVLAAARHGDEYRRCAMVAASPEGGRLMENLNWLLDRRPGPALCPTEDAALREAVVGLVDRFTEAPAVIGDREGRVVAVNLLALDEGVRPAGVADDVARHGGSLGWRVSPLSEGVWLALRVDVTDTVEEAPPEEG
jgi:hypothetical protein